MAYSNPDPVSAGVRCEVESGSSFGTRCTMQDLNPILNKISELRGRSNSLRGYL